MKIDDSFKKPGSVPFKWEIRPGVPKLQNPQPKPEFRPEKHHQRKQKHVPKKQSSMITPFQETPRKLKPPPAGLYFHDPLEARTRTDSFGSSPRTLSNRFGIPGPSRPDIVSSGGCFPSPLGKLKHVKGSGRYHRSEPDCYSEIETPSRWSVSSRKSVSPLPSSYQSSPRPVFDADWAGFGLF